MRRALMLSAVLATASPAEANELDDNMLASEFPETASLERRRLVDIDGDGTEDSYSVSSVRTRTPKSFEYQAYFREYVDAYNCETGYFGYECAKRTCPYGIAWVASMFLESDPSDDLYTPWGSDTSMGQHSYQECSQKGVCNRNTGKCQCFAGYHGKGCRYKSCPNDCGTHGVCQPAYVVNSNYMASIPQTDQVWDWDRSFRCECDYGYTGIDCSDRLCPSGVDPVNPDDCAVPATGEEFFGSDQQVIRFPSDLPHTQWFYLEFESEFGGVPLRTHAIEYDPTYPAKLAGNIQDALETLPNAALPSVQTRILADDDGYSGTVLVAFTDDTTPGRQQLLGCFSPGPDDASAGCDGVFPKVESINPTAVECETAYYNDESEIFSSYECSGRGECDRASGKCDCHSGFNGPRCQTMFSFF